MKALNKQAQRYRADQAEKERQRKREEYLASLTEEERAKFLENEKKRRREAIQALGTLVGISSMFGNKY